MSTLPINTKLQSGVFVVGKALGQGGFGVTYHGADAQLKRCVAIKEFFPLGCVRQGDSVQPSSTLDSISYANAKANFLEEARTLAQFRHPGIVQVYTFFEENNTAYMVMEFLRGKTFAQLVQERGALPEQEAVEHIKKVGAALEKVHLANLLHRDVKPENVIICDDGRIVLIDFGLTKKIEQTVGLGTRRLTATTRFGSNGYAPPEQHTQRAQMGTFTDIYALGATLYFLLTGEVPVSSTDRMYGVDLAEIQSLKPQTSRAVNDAVTWAMRIKENQRPQKLGEFLQALQAKPKPQPTSISNTAPAKKSSIVNPIATPPTTPTSKPDRGQCPKCGQVNFVYEIECLNCKGPIFWDDNQEVFQVPNRIADNWALFITALAICGAVGWCFNLFGG